MRSLAGQGAVASCRATTAGATKTRARYRRVAFLTETDLPQAPEVIDTCLVVREFIPETNDLLTLEEDNLVYVFSKDAAVTGKEGYWLGETKFVKGIFPASHVKHVDT